MSDVPDPAPLPEGLGICRSRILTASAENLDPSILRGHILCEKSGCEGYKLLRRRLRRAGLRSGWGAVDCVGSDHSMSS